MRSLATTRGAKLGLPLEGSDTVRRTPARRPGVRLELAGIAVANIRSNILRRAAVQISADSAVHFLLDLLVGPEQLAALLRISGQAEDAGEQRRRYARSANLTPAAGRICVVERHAVRDSGDVVAGPVRAQGILLPRRLRLDGATATARGPNRLGVRGTGKMQERAADGKDVVVIGGILHAVAAVTGAREIRDALMIEGATRRTAAAAAPAIGDNRRAEFYGLFFGSV